MKNPCMNCPKAGCGVYHDKCPEYQAFRKEQFEDYEKRKRISNLRYDISSIVKRNLHESERFYKKP